MVNTTNVANFAERKAAQQAAQQQHHAVVATLQQARRDGGEDTILSAAGWHTVSLYPLAHRVNYQERFGSTVGWLFGKADWPTLAEERQESLNAISRVITYLSGQWYETEYGAVEMADRWYQQPMIFMENHLAAVARGNA